MTVTNADDMGRLRADARVRRLPEAASMTTLLWCDRCGLMVPLAEWRHATPRGVDDGAGVIGRSGVLANARIYKHNCNWWAVVMVPPDRGTLRETRA